MFPVEVAAEADLGELEVAAADLVLEQPAPGEGQN